MLQGLSAQVRLPSGSGVGGTMDEDNGVAVKTDDGCTEEGLTAWSEELCAALGNWVDTVLKLVLDRKGCPVMAAACEVSASDCRCSVEAVDCPSEDDKAGEDPIDGCAGDSGFAAEAEACAVPTDPVRVLAMTVLAATGDTMSVDWGALADEVAK